jgi:hypothetical protein
MEERGAFVVESEDAAEDLVVGTGRDRPQAALSAEAVLPAVFDRRA